MNRRRFLSLVASAPLLPSVALAATERDYRRVLPDHLHALAVRAGEIRSEALRAITTPQAIEARKTWARETLWKLVGGMPERTPLAIRTLGEVTRPCYRIEKIAYQSRPGTYVSANLYVPSDRKGPFPGVLFQMGHFLVGKAAAPYQLACRALAERGFLVLAFDPAGQGERIEYPRLANPDDEHDRTGRALLLVGETQTRLMLWDAVRSLDVLAAHPDVDSERLASAGHSGGGTLTMLLAAADDRLAAAAVACGNTEDVAGPSFEAPGPIDDAEQNLIGSGPAGFDRWDLLFPLAPQPLLVLVSARDATDLYSPRYILNGRAEIEQLARIYDAIGSREDLRWIESPEPHGLSRDRRDTMVRWISEQLGGDASVRDDAEPKPELEETTWVAGGNVVRAFAGERVIDAVRARAETLARTRSTVDVGARLGASMPRRGITPTSVSHADVEGTAIEVLEIETAPNVALPARLFAPASGTARAITIALDPEGWRAHEAAWRALARRGHAICAADVRGVGDACPAIGAGASGYGRVHSVDDGFAWASLVLGKSLVVQRVTDVLAFVEAIANHPASRGRSIAIAARGSLGLVALFAAAIDARVGAIYLDGSLVSYRATLDADDPCKLVDVIPGVLAWTDLPDVAALLRPRPVIHARPIDGAGRRVALENARAIHRGADNVRFVDDDAWASEAMMVALGA